MTTKTADHPVFDRFSRVTSEARGGHMYDFVGAATATEFKSAWHRFGIPAGKSVTPGLPPLNEHYLDWIAVLRAVDRAGPVFRMAELGAGWAPWLVRAALAARQRTGISRVELLGVEADPTHYAWMLRHFRDNGVEPEAHYLLHGAASAEDGTLRFPVVADPAVDYGARLLPNDAEAPCIDVPAYSLETLLRRFGGPVDFLHVDVQGAEYGLFAASMAALGAGVRSVMVGTHNSDAEHDGLAARLRNAGWTEVMAYGRKSVARTAMGDIQLDDGFLLFDNPSLLPAS